MIELAGYIITIGVATYLMKVALRDLSAYQVNLLMGAAMVAVSVPAVLIADGGISLPRRGLGIGILVAVLMAVGSILYSLALQQLDAGPAAAIATSYVVVVFVLSAAFLGEQVDLVSVAGIALTLSGVALLSFRA